MCGYMCVTVQAFMMIKVSNGNVEYSRYSIYNTNGYKY